VACPFFLPLAPLESGPWSQYWTHRPRLPLGEAYAGVCRAIPDSPHAPPDERQRELCNCGYARGLCDRFPAGAAADAVRFSVIAEEPLRLIYILEKDHAPVSHGELDPSGPCADQILVAQARAFAESYARLPLRGTKEDNSTKRTDPSERFPGNGSSHNEQAQVEGNVKARRKSARSSAGQ